MRGKNAFHIPWGTEAQRRILLYMLKNEDKEVAALEMQDKIGISQRTITNALQNMEIDGVVVSRKVGSYRYFRFNEKCPWIEDYKALLKRLRRSKFTLKEF